jgi:hypothetical protein
MCSFQEMKKAGSRVLIAVIPAVAGGTALWFYLGPGPGGNSPPGTRIQAVAVPSARDRDHRLTRAVPEFETKEFKAYALERCSKWMEGRNRDAASLIAMWDLTEDESLLNEAAEKFPNDPRVCAAMVAHLINKGNALPWVERLLSVEPGNANGWYWKAQMLSKSGKPEEALEAMRTATGMKGPLENQLRGRMITAREAALASGFTVKEAAYIALAPLRNGGSPSFSGSMLSLLKSEMETAKAAGNGDRLADIARLGTAAAEQMGRSGAPTFIEDLVRLTALQLVFEQLDPATEIGIDGLTAGARLTETTARKAELMELNRTAGDKVDPELKNLTDSQASEYADRYILHGGPAALRWLNTQHLDPPAKPGSHVK